MEGFFRGIIVDGCNNQITGLFRFIFDLFAVINRQNIFIQDQDAWGQGSAGSTQLKKATKVYSLDGQPCQVSEHLCQGVYHCSELDMTLLDGCQRYDPDEDEMRQLFEAERDINISENSTVENLAAVYVPIIDLE